MPLALVTGAARRVGRATALHLAREGFDVVVHSNTAREEAKTLVTEIESLGRSAWIETADFSQLDAATKLGARIEARHAALDVLVLNASAYQHRAFEAVTPQEFDAMVTVNVRAPFFLTQRLLPTLRAAAQPCVVAITDVAVTHAYGPEHLFSHYIASKAALAQLVRSWALELAPRIRVNAVAPGPVMIGAETPDAGAAKLVAQLPLRREGEAADIARAVVFLVHNSYVTGSTITVDGGLQVT